MRKLILFAVIYIAAASCGMGQVYQGPSFYPHDIFGGLVNAPCQTRARQSNSTGIVRSALDLNNATTGWEGYWHDLKVGGRWFICDPMDNAFMSNSFEIPGLNQGDSAGYPSLLRKYGDPPASVNQAVITYMNAEAKRMQAFGFNTVGNNLGTENVEDLYLPFPNDASATSVANPPMPFFYWPHPIDIAMRRMNFASPSPDNWGYHPIKLITAELPTLVFGEPQAFPGAVPASVPNVDFRDVFDPQLICASYAYNSGTAGVGLMPSYCPAKNNVAATIIASGLVGGSVSGTTETLMNGSSTGPFPPGTYTITIANSAGLSQCAAASAPCTVMIDPGLADGEDVQISNISGATFQATTTQSHPQGFIVRSGTDWIFAVTPSDSDYMGALVDPATMGEGGDDAFSPQVDVLVEAPSATISNFQADGSAWGTTTFTANVTHNPSAPQTVAVASGSALPCGQGGVYIDVSKGTSSEEIVSCTNVDATHISAVFRLDHASGDSLTSVYGTGENGPPFAYFGPSGLSQSFTALSAAIAAGAQCLTVVQTAPFSTAAPNNTVTFDPGMKGYDSTTYEDGPYTVDGIGASGPAGCNGANNVHITAGTAHAHASGAMLETPLGIDTVNHTKAELQAWFEGSGISGSYGTGAGSFDDLTSGTGYGTGDAGICKLDEAWGLIESSYNCTTLTGWPLTYAGTLTQAVTGSATAQTVTVSSTTGIAVGRYLDADPATASREMVRITAIGAGTVTGVFLQNHSSGAVIQAGGYAHWGSNSAWNEDSTKDPGRYFLDENGFHTWISAITGTPGAYNGWYANAIGNTTTTNSVAPGSSVTIDVADIRGIREGTKVYLDLQSLTNRQVVTATNVTADTYPAGHFTATVTGAYTYPVGTRATSQMFNDLDSFIMHLLDYYSASQEAVVNGSLPGVPLNPIDHVEGSRYAIWAGLGRTSVMFEGAFGPPGNLCITGQEADNAYTESGNQVPIIVYYRPDAQNDSIYRDLSTTSNDAVTATGSQTVHLACAESGAYPCNVPASSSTAYNTTIDPNTASEEVASCKFSLVAGAGNSTMTCTFAKTHAAGFAVWAAITHVSNAYAMEDWSTPTQADKGQMYFDYWLTGATESYCPTQCSAWTAPITAVPFCPAFGYGSNPPPAAFPKPFGNLAGTAGGAWNFQADNGDYPFVGTAVWQMYPWNDSEDYGFATQKDNQYDGKEDVTQTLCTNWEGYSCGGELMNYGDALTKVTQANHQVWNNMAQWLGNH